MVRRTAVARCKSSALFLFHCCTKRILLLTYNPISMQYDAMRWVHKCDTSIRFQFQFHLGKRHSFPRRNLIYHLLFDLIAFTWSKTHHSVLHKVRLLMPNVYRHIDGRRHLAGIHLEIQSSTPHISAHTYRKILIFNVIRSCNVQIWSVCMWVVLRKLNINAHANIKKGLS